MMQGITEEVTVRPHWLRVRNPESEQIASRLFDNKSVIRWQHMQQGSCFTSLAYGMEAVSEVISGME